MGINPAITEQLERGRGLAAVWQLKEAGCTRSEIRHAARELRNVHQGVLLSGNAPLTDWQRWKAATLTTPTTYLAEWSGATYAGFRQGDRWPTTVKRQGEGGPRTFGVGTDSVGTLRVYYSNDISRDLTSADEIPMLLPARTLLDLTDRVSDKTARRYMRDALRSGALKPADLQLQIARQHGRRGIERFRQYAVEYGKLGLDRGRSDAESLAVALLAAAGASPPAVNVLVAGEEADLVSYEQRLIVELDGPQFHLFITEDARKQAAWERAGFVVRRLPTDDVYDRPHLLLAAATAPVTPEERAIAAATRSAADVIPRLEAERAQPNGRKWSL